MSFRRAAGSRWRASARGRPTCCAALPAEEPAWVRHLALAADQFVVRRSLADGPGPTGTAGRTIIAGYPWFGDWGRDTMIALPGLTLSTGRAGIAADILRTFRRYLDRGMSPQPVSG